MPAAETARGIIHDPVWSEPTSEPLLSTIDETAVFLLESLADGFGIFTIPGTQYRLHLAVEEGLEECVGGRVRGRVHGRSLRMHHSPAGGNFIEPLEGRPRIVQGTVIAVDPGTHEVLVDLVVPIRLAIPESQSTASFATGDMVNFYMEPGASFHRD